MKMIGMVSIVLAVLQLQVSYAACATTDYANSTPLELFQEYIKINTTTYNDLTEAVEFWRALASLANVPIGAYEFVEGFPIVVMKWAGTNSSERSIMLNSHMDVVPANMEDGWKYDPFSGYMDEYGDIYGRGTQDTKAASIQYYEALRRFKENNVTLLRNVYMTLMPDEEVGAESGMIPFLRTEEFAAMNVGVVLDEGAAYPLPYMAVFYQDKVMWQIQVDCRGNAGHGSSFPKKNSTATGKCSNVIERLFAFRDEQYKLYVTSPMNDAGGYTSVNLNKMNAGTANNVFPNLVSLVFDIRLGNTVNEEEFDATLRQWIAEAGENITMNYILKNPQSPATMANSTNPYWTAISTAADELGLGIMPTVVSGSTDSRHIRNAGYPAFGMAPMPSTELLAHSVNERLAVATFVRGFDVYERIIEKLANLPAGSTADNSGEYNYPTAL